MSESTITNSLYNSGLSIIIPVLNEAETINKTLATLKSSLSNNDEIIIVDGGSTDKTLGLCRNFTEHCFQSNQGRAQQMNVGASKANNETLVFLHADTLVPHDFSSVIRSEVNKKLTADKKMFWGFFKVRLSGSQFVFKIISSLINFRSCLSRIATGDQVIFVSKELFNNINGYPNIPLMEDISISRCLKKLFNPICIQHTVTTSSRKWITEGVISTILLMWKIRFLFFIGVAPEKLVKIYYK